VALANGKRARSRSISVHTHRSDPRTLQITEFKLTTYYSWSDPEPAAFGVTYLSIQEEWKLVFEKRASISG
jgi:hypothetical protein